MSFGGASTNPHNVAREAFGMVDGVVQPAPAPRFSRTPGAVQQPPAEPGADTRAGLADWGLAPSEIEALIARGAIAEVAQPEAGAAAR